jgi:hypothetical protein
VAPDKQDMPVGQLTIVVIAEVTIPGPPGLTWHAGPLEMSWRVGTPKEVRSNTAGRVYYLNEGLEACLYRSENDPIRWHKLEAQPLPNPLAGTVTAVELLSLPSLSRRLPSLLGLAAIHIRTEEVSHREAREVVYAVTNLNRRHGTSMRELVDSLLSGDAMLTSNSRRVPAVSYLYTSEYSTSPFAEALEAASTTQQWLYLLDNQARIPPSLEQLVAASGRDIPVSDDYCARVTAQGISIVTEPGPVTPSRLSANEAISFFARGLYVDLLLFCHSQTVLLRDISVRATAALEGNSTEDALDKLRGAVLRFRRLYLRSDFAPQPPYDHFLQEYDRAVQLESALTRVQKDIDDLASMVQSALTRQTNAFLGLITIVALPLTAAISIWQVLDRGNVLSLVVSLAIAGLVGLTLVLGTNARALIKDIRVRRRPVE